jgi:hypothetical protein
MLKETESPSGGENRQAPPETRVEPAIERAPVLDTGDKKSVSAQASTPGGFRATWARAVDNSRIGKVQTPSGKWPPTIGAKSTSYFFEVKEYARLAEYRADYEARMKDGRFALVTGEPRPNLDLTKPHRRVKANFINAASTKLTIDFDGLTPDDADTPIDSAGAYSEVVMSVALGRMPEAFKRAKCMVAATSSTGLKTISTGAPSEGKARVRGTWELSRSLTCTQKETLAEALKALPGLECVDDGLYPPEHFEFVTRPIFLPGQTDPIREPVYALPGGLLDVDAVCAELGIDLDAKGDAHNRSSAGQGSRWTAKERLAHALAMADSVVNGPWFDDRRHWVGYAHTMRNVFGRDLGWVKFEEFNNRRVGADGKPVANDPVEDREAYDGLKNSQNDIGDLAGYAREHGGETGRAAYYDFIFPDLTPEDEAVPDGIATAVSEKAAADWETTRAKMSRMARFKRALKYDQLLAPNTQRQRVFDTGPFGFITFDSNYLPTIGTIVPRVAPWLFRNEVTTKVAGPATGKTTHLVLTAVAIATERPDILGLKNGELKRFGDCILFCNEDQTTKTHNQILAVLKTFGLTKNALKHAIHVERSKFVLVTPSGNRGEPEPSDDAIRIAEKIARVRETAEIAYVGLDTLLSLAGSVSTNGPEGIMTILGMAYDIAGTFGCAVEVLHHFSKAGGKTSPSDMMSALGSMSMPATVRGAIHLLSIEEDEAKRYGWPPEKALQVVKQIEAKNSNAKKGAAGAMFYEWRSVSIMAEDPSDPNAAATFGTEDVGVLVPITSPAVRQVTAAKALTALHQAQGAGRKVRRGGGRGRRSGDDAHSILAHAFGLPRDAAEAAVVDLIDNHGATVDPVWVRGNLVEFLILPRTLSDGEEIV